MVQHQVTRGQRRGTRIGVGGIEDDRARGGIVPTEDEVVRAGEGRGNRQFRTTATQVVTRRTRNRADARGDRARVDGVDRGTDTEEREVREVNRSQAVAGECEGTRGRAENLARGEPSVRIRVEAGSLERAARKDFNIHARRQNCAAEQFHRATGQGVTPDL